ncbi:MAG: hypothetical protein ACI4K9_08935 [Candidatus Fimenecus sp.]
MRKQIWIKTVSGLLAGALLCTSFAGCQKKTVTENQILDVELNGTEYVQQTYSTMAESAKKEETVYINTKPDGTIYNVQVTDWLHTDTPQVRLQDVSNLTEIQNVKTLTQPVVKDGALYWDMDTTDLYYSGVSETQPPITFTIRYFLNGEEKTAEEIAGQKGNVAIEITVSNSLKKKVTVSGKTYEITCPMLVAGGTILPEETFTNIAIDYGTAMSDGAKQVIFFTGVPGINESLGLSDLDMSLIDESMYTNTYTITAYTECFELGNLMFAVIPFSSIGSLGNGGVVESIDGVKEILTDVEKIQAAMNGLDMQKTIDLLYGDANKMEEIMGVVTEATQLYSENEKMLKVMGSYMTEENMAKLDKLVTDLNNTDLEAVSSTLSDPQMQLLLKLLPKLSESLADVAVLADDLNDVMPIYESLAKDMEDPEIQKSIENLPQTLEQLNHIVSVLEENQALLENLGALASDDKAAQVEVLVETAEKYSGSVKLSEAQTQVLADRMKAWLNYGNEYDIFTMKTGMMTSSVLFTYKTDGISVPEAAEPVEAVPEEAEENKFIAWVKGLFT